ncbi:MAG: hypothetical protein VW397_04840, partial [Candidatus Margulisiibacteriota bacterium]
MKDECLNLVPHAHIDLDNQNRYALPLMEHSMRECMTVRKAYVLADVIEEFQPHWVLMLDVDTLCRKNLMPWINSLLETKVAMAIVKNDGLVDHPRRFQSQYSASLIFLASSAFHVAFQWHYFIQTPKKMMGYDSFQYFWDQVALYATVSQFEDELNICYLAADLFVDEAFSNAAYFWTWGTVVE